MALDHDTIAAVIDHSLLAPNLQESALEAGCRIALEHKVTSVCTVPYFVPRALELLRESSVRPTTTIGFPHGVQTTSVKRAEAERAIADGALELDMVVNVSKVLSLDWNYVTDDIEAVIDVAHARERLVKVIFENAYLADEHKRRLCEICGRLGADWVKTSTGFAGSGSTAHDLKLMRECSPPNVQIKASGGIRSLDALLEARALGATRVGTSHTQAIFDELADRAQREP